MASEVISIEVLGDVRVPDPAGDGNQGTKANGWVVKVVTPFRSGATFDPSKVIITSVDEGYNTSGVRDDKTRNIRGGEIIRRQYVQGSSPASNTLRLASQVASNWEVYISLREAVYTGATVTAAVEAGYYGAATAGTVTTVTNNSTRAYPEPQVGWLNAPGFLAGNSVTLEGVAFSVLARNGQQVAAVGFYAEDNQATKNVTPEVITGSTVLSDIVTGSVTGTQRPEVWRATINTSTLTQGDTCLAYMKVYPWIGPVWNQKVGGSGFPSMKADQALRFVADKNGTYGGVYAYVNDQTGNDTSGIAHLDAATARATPCKTMAGALAKARSYNAASRTPTHNDTGGAIIRVMDNAGAAYTHTLTTSAASTGGIGYATVEPDPLNAAAVTLSIATVNLGVCSNIRFRGINIIQNAGNFSGTVTTGIIVLDNLTWDQNGYTTNPGTLGIGSGYFRNTEFINRASNNVLAGTYSYPQAYANIMVAGCRCTSTTGNISVNACFIVGNYIENSLPQIEFQSSHTNKTDTQNGAIIYNNRWLKCSGQGGSGTQRIINQRGQAWVQNVIESNFLGAVMRMSNDGSPIAVENVHFQYNTIPTADSGAQSHSRFNMCYADVIASARVNKEGYLLFNNLGNLNMKTETFDGTNVDPTGRTGNWFTRYRVGSRGNWIKSNMQSDSAYNANGGTAGVSGGNWLGEFNPGDTVGGVCTFTDNKAGEAGTTGLGTYTLTGASNPAYALVPATQATLKYDLGGFSRLNDGTGAAGAYERTPAVDTTPDAFTFTDQTGVNPSTVTTSNSITVAGINSAASISITAGEYQINGGSWVTASSTVTNGQTVAVRHTSSASYSTSVNTVLTIGGVSDTFTSTTRAADITPDAFAFTDQTDVALSSTITSNSITVAGIEAATAISITGGEYQINGGSWVSASGNVTNGQTVAVRHTSSASFSTAVNTTLTIGGVSDTFTSTTLAADTTPNAFTFTDQTGVGLSTLVTSNAVTISGINAVAPISVTGGEYQISGGSWVTASGTVSNGQTVAVRHTSAATGSTATNTVLTIGGVSDTFTSTTTSGLDTTPDAFSFTSQAGVTPSTVVMSNGVVITGINTASPISVSGGEYMINGGAWLTGSSTVTNGQTVVVRHTSSSSYSATVTTTLTVGGVSGTFSSTTLAPPPSGFTRSRSRNVLFEVVPLSFGGSFSTFRMSRAGITSAGTNLNGQLWMPIIVDGPKRSITVFDGDSGETQTVEISHGSLTFLLDGQFGNADWSTYSWEGATAKVWIGYEGDTFASYTQIFEGQCGPLQRSGQLAQVSLLGPEASLNKPLLTLSYAGTGGAEGPANLKGNLKPWASGACQNVAPVLIDSINWIYQVHGYGAINDVQKVYENALDLGTVTGTDAASYAALAALPLTPGQWAKCTSAGLFRLGAEPKGKITADIQGAKNSGTYVSTLGTIAAHLLAWSGVPPAKIDAASLGAFSQSWAFYTTDPVQVGDVVRDAFSSAGGYLIPDSTAVWKAGDYFAATPAYNLNASALVTNVEQLATTPPAYRVKVGGNRCFSVHSDNEISQLLLQNGQSVAEISCFKRNPIAPTAPTGGSYDFGTKVLTPPAGWSVAPPATGTDPCWMARGSAFVAGTSGTATPSWASTVGKAFQDGVAGVDGQSLDIIYQRSGAQPSTPAASTGVPSGWYPDPGSVPAGAGLIWSSVGERATVGGNFVWQTAVVIEGQTGSAGLNNAIIYAYQRSSSGAPALPSASTTYDFGTKTLTGLNNGWSASFPVGSDPLYATAATASSNTSNDTIAAGEWSSAVLLASSGGTGATGATSATVYLYQRNNTGSAPAVPSVTTTYTFSTATLANINNGWSQAVPAASGGKYLFVTTATALSNSGADTIGAGEWASPQIMAQDGAPGADGLSIAEVSTFIRQASTPSVPSGGSYNFSTKTLTAPSGWSVAPPSGADPLWMVRGTAFTAGVSGSATPTWAAVGKVSENGTNGADGQALDIVYQRAASQPSTPGASAGVPSGWYGDPASVPAGAGVIWSSVGERANPASNYVWQTPVQLQGTNGTNGVSALDVSATPNPVTVACTYNGTPKAAIPGFTVTASQAGSTVTGSATYSITTSNLTGVSGGSGVGANTVTVAGISADTGYAEVTVSNGGATQKVRVNYTKVKDAAAFVNGTDSTINNPGTSYATVGQITLTVGPNGTASLDYDVGLLTTTATSTTINSYLTYNTGSGDTVIAAGSGDPNPFIPGLDAGNAYDFCSQSLSGIAANTTVTFKLWMKRTSGATSINYGSFNVQWNG